MQRGSQQDTDGMVWTTAAMKLGARGLDLRQPSEPTSLVKLLNARFLDDRTVQRRGGHTGYRMMDSSGFPQFRDANNNPQSFNMDPGNWLYGFGAQLQNVSSNAQASGDEHVPVAGRGGGTFRFAGEDVFWTGDRLLVSQGVQPALGSSSFWDAFNQATPLSWGIPAYLPVQSDSTPPDTVAGSFIQTCVTSTRRFVVATGVGVSPTAWVTDRVSGALINKSSLGGGTAPGDLRLFVSGAFVVCIWRDTSSNNLNISSWTGSSWTAVSVIDTSVNAFDVSVVPGGFHLVYRVAAALYISKYVGKQLVDSPYTHKTQINVGATAAPNGAVSVAVSGTRMAVVWTASNGGGSTGGLYYRIILLDSMTQGSNQLLNGDLNAFDAGLTVAPRTVKHTLGPMGFVAYAAQTSSGATFMYQFGTGDARSDVRYRSAVASTAFVVGNEVFCWLRSLNSGVNYLVASAHLPFVSGFADREEAASRAVDVNVQGLAQVNADPLSSSRFTWARPWNTQLDYSRPGNVRIGDLEFLPQLSAVQYGKSVYLAGSNTRCWDGVQLMDAGFQDYPVTLSFTHGASGSLSAGTYQFRVYAVKYNAQGEKFQSAALTFTAAGVLNSEKVTLTIATLPCTNDTVMLEVFRTTAGGTTFYYDGSVANSLAAASVQYQSTIADTTLITHRADPFQTGVGSTSEIENWGPVGCSFLTVSGDRLWAAGGQVPAGYAQFSKLHEDGSGVGFDDLAPYEQIDIQGAPITSMAAFNDATVFFQADRIYLLGGDGPDNFGTGNFSIPQLRLVDGAVTHYGTIVAQIGVLYWGADGPRLLAPNYTVENICLPVRPLTSGLVPTGVRADLSRQEVIWYTNTGTAVLYNYQTDTGRFAQWSGLYIAGCSQYALATVDGYLLYEDDSAMGDNGVPYEFAFATGDIRPEELREGYTLLRRIGLSGTQLGQHVVRGRIYYDGSPLWSEEFTWQPDTGTWLADGNSVSTLTPAAVDALAPADQSGSYGTSKRAHRQTCHHFRVEFSDVSAFQQTFIAYEIAMEIGAKPGLGRTPVNTFVP